MKRLLLLLPLLLFALPGHAQTPSLIYCIQATQTTCNSLSSTSPYTGNEGDTAWQFNTKNNTNWIFMGPLFDLPNNSLVGNSFGSANHINAILLGTNLTMVGNTLNASGGGSGGSPGGSLYSLQFSNTSGAFGGILPGSTGTFCPNWSSLSAAPTLVTCPGASSSPGGSNTNIQYNNSGAFGGANATYVGGIFGIPELELPVTITDTSQSPISQFTSAYTVPVQLTGNLHADTVSVYGYNTLPGTSSLACVSNSDPWCNYFALETNHEHQSLPPDGTGLATGTATSGTTTTLLTDSSGAWTSGQFVDYTLYDSTHAGSCNISANTGTTLTCSTAITGMTSGDTFSVLRREVQDYSALECVSSPCSVHTTFNPWYFSFDRGRMESDGGGTLEMLKSQIYAGTRPNTNGFEILTDRTCGVGSIGPSTNDSFMVQPSANEVFQYPCSASEATQYIQVLGGSGIPGDYITESIGGTVYLDLDSTNTGWNLYYQGASEASCTGTTNPTCIFGEATGNGTTTVNGGSGGLNLTTSGTAKVNSLPITATVASGSQAMGTSAIASGACATVINTTTSGVASTDIIVYSPNTDMTAVTGYVPSTSGVLTVYPPVPSAGNIAWKVCNMTGASITPAALTFNYRVVR